MISVRSYRVIIIDARIFKMFNFDCRSVMNNVVTMASILLILFCGVLFGSLLSGCAVSGCGNPISHNNVDSNDYINEQNSVTVSIPDHKLREKIKREKFAAKYKRQIYREPI